MFCNLLGLSNEWKNRVISPKNFSSAKLVHPISIEKDELILTQSNGLDFSNENIDETEQDQCEKNVK